MSDFGPSRDELAPVRGCLYGLAFSAALALLAGVVIAVLLLYREQIVHLVRALWWALW